MADVSERLRNAREQAGLDIHDVSATTRIKPAFLYALESGTFEKLPSPFYVRTFLRAYARELGLDPDEVAAEYEASRRPVAVAAGPPLPRSPVRGFVSTVRERPQVHLSRNLWPVAALAVILLVVARLAGPDSPTTSAEAGAVGTSGTSVPAAAASAPTEAASATGQPDTLTLEITPKDTVWVAATADGERAVYRMLQPGERVRVEARNKMAFRIGNAGAFEYSINGAPGKPIGRAGEVRDFQVTSANYRAYLR